MKKQVEKTILPPEFRLVFSFLSKVPWCLRSDVKELEHVDELLKEHRQGKNPRTTWSE